MISLTASQTLAQAFGVTPPPAGVPVLPCGLCGALAPCRPASQVLKATFTNSAELRSPYVCWACQACLDDSRSRSSLLVIKGCYRRLARAEIWPLLLDPPSPPFLIYVTISGQKHGIWRQEVTTDRACFRLQCEQLGAVFRPAVDREWMRLAVELVLAGAARSSVESGRYSASDYRAVGIATIRAAERSLAPIRPTDLFNIVYGLMPGKKDLTGVLL